ncbi:sugar phosphate isomerase/epimerase family protein [Candidatus Pantoea multigeneris]|uniref:Sugar phosphate isomerase/epimerase n=1 Tax=Candidatus Pantoea multigeneris TaxID=2608357 RepID=A0ABX0RDB6_9GAMM|nr:sugar phosphate isomerase/epimerase [Pantoea multigeneris]NIF22301.1 sugar phosphate isomerase/epimerase [Pantoea multigeneris]
MNKGIFSKTFPTQSVDENFQLIHALGYQGTQFNFSSAGLNALPHFIPDSVLEDVKQASQRHRVCLEAISATFNMTHPDSRVIKQGLISLETVCQAARRLHCPVVTLCTGSRDPADQWRFHPDNLLPESWKILQKTMEDALKIAEKHDVVLGIEPELANVVNSSMKARQLIDEMQSRFLKVILDPANLFEIATLHEQHRVVAEAFDLLADEIAIAHAKDRNPDGTFTTAGRGVLDYHYYLQQLRHAGFTGCVVTHGLEAEDAAEVSLMLDKHLKLLEGSVA